MPQPVDRVGDFRGTIIEYGLREYESGSVAVAIVAQLDELFSDDQWHPWGEYQMEATGYIIIIKKDGSTNQKQIEALCQFAGWDGSITSIVQGQWKPTPCQFNIKENVYQGQTSYRIEFVNAFDRTPGGALNNVDESKAKDLQARFGSSLKAIAGNVKRNAPPVNGSKPAAPPKKIEKQPEPVLPIGGPQPNDDIPF